MAKKNKKGRQGVVFSTNPDYEYRFGDDGIDETPPPEKQNLQVIFEHKGRGGKQVTIVTGFVGSENDLKSLSKVLKSACGVGGSAKEGEIIIQGDLRSKIVTKLSNMGYRVK